MPIVISGGKLIKGAATQLYNQFPIDNNNRPLRE